jgi:hypothetical protein
MKADAVLTEGGSRDEPQYGKEKRARAMRAFAVAAFSELDLDAKMPELTSLSSIRRSWRTGLSEPSRSFVGEVADKRNPVPLFDHLFKRAAERVEPAREHDDPIRLPPVMRAEAEPRGRQVLRPTVRI